MSQVPPPAPLEVQGKGITQKVDLHKSSGSYEATAAVAAAAATPAHVSKKSMHLVGTSVLPHKGATAKVARATGPSQASHPLTQTSPLLTDLSHGLPTPLTAAAASTTKRIASTTAATAVGPAGACGSHSIELSLVRNLKQQIACLEAQLRVIKQQHDATERSCARKAGKGEGEAAGRNAAHPSVGEDGWLHQKDVALPMPHAVRVHHVDSAVVAGALTSTACDVEVGRLRAIPEAYQLERSALQHTVESLTKDIEGLQSFVLDVRRERDAMAAEVVQFRSALRESVVEHEAMASECAATLRLLEAERALRRAAEEDVAACTHGRRPTGAQSSSDLATVDAVSQRDYYKLQGDRLKGSVAREKARAESLSAALLQERGRSSTQEKQLCSALDRIALMEKRQQQLAAYFQTLSARFVTVSAMLRHILDVVPADLLRERRVPSPERVESAGAEDGVGGMDKVTLAEIRETLAAWQDEALMNAAHLSESTLAAVRSPAKDMGEEAGAAGGGVNESAVELSAPPLFANFAEGPCDVVAGDSKEHSMTSPPDMMAAATVPSIARGGGEAAALFSPACDAGKEVAKVAHPEAQKEPAECSLVVPALNAAQQAVPADVTEHCVSAPPPSLPPLNPQSVASSCADEGDLPHQDSGAAPVEAMEKTATDAASPVVCEISTPSTPPVTVLPEEEEEQETAAAAGCGDDAVLGESAAAPETTHEGAADDAAARSASLPPEEPVSSLAAALPAVSSAPLVEEGKEKEGVNLAGAAADAPEANADLPAAAAATSLAADAAFPVVASTSPTEDAGASETKEEMPLVVDEVAPLPSSPPAEVKDESPPSLPPSRDAAEETGDPQSAGSNLLGGEEGDATAPPTEVPASAEARAPPSCVMDNPTYEAGITATEVRESPLPLPSSTLDENVVPPPPLMAAAPPPPPPSTFSVPPPVLASVPVPMPPGGVSLPLPPGGVSVPLPVPVSSHLPVPPTVVVPSNAAPAAPAPPTLEQQLSQLDARIDAQNNALAELVQRHQEPS
jgi:hypothetical protein